MEKEEFLSLCKSGQTDFSKRDLSNIYLVGHILTGLNFSNATMKNVDFHSADIENCIFDGVLLEDVSFRFAKINNSSFKAANLRTTSLYSAHFVRTDFSNADLTNAVAGGARFESCNFHNAVVDGVNFCATAFAETTLENANLNDIKNDVIRYCESVRSTFGDRFIPYLVKSIERGFIDGGSYGDGEGEAACLVGTIANAFCIDPDDLDQDAASLRETWFLAIDTYDTPETNPFSKIALQWLTERYSDILARPEYADIDIPALPVE